MEDIIYTAQRDIVSDTINTNGIYQVKKEYVLEKYGKEVSKIFFIAYDWFIKNTANKVKNEDKDYPIWGFKEKKYARKFSKGKLLTLKMNRENIVYFDQKKWERVLNLDYVTDDKLKYFTFHNNLKQQGISSIDQVFLTPYYPMLKRQIIDSWTGIFKTTKARVIGAAVFSIKKKHVIENE